MAILKGTLRYDSSTTKMAFYAMGEELLIGGGKKLNDAEIIVYAMMLIKGYRPGKNTSKYTGGLSKLAAITSISSKTIKKAVDGLIEKGMLKKILNGVYVATQNPVKKNYLMVSTSLLMSKVLTVRQKAFILRLAVIKSGIPEDISINNSEIAKVLQISRSSVINTFNVMINTEWTGVWRERFKDLTDSEEIKWIFSIGEEVVINFDMIHSLVTRELNEELENFRSIEAKSISNKKFEDIVNNEPDNLWLKVHGKTSDKKRKLINALEDLRSSNIISNKKAEVLLKYIHQSRLSYVREFINSIKED